MTDEVEPAGMTARARTRRLAATAVMSISLVVSGAATAGARPPDTPEYAAGVVIGELATGNAAAAWQNLHPAQQRIVSQQAYKACRASKGTLAIDTTNTRAVSKSKARITIPGTNVKALSSALVIKLVLTNGQSQNITVHEIRVKRAWRYILNASEVAACRDS